jgi:hypothetical protein
MTIALGILAEDGIVVAADTEESAGTLKSETTKILYVLGEIPAGDPGASNPAPPSSGVCLISGAGDSGYVSTLMLELADVFLDDKTRVQKPLQQAFEDQIKSFHSDHIIPFAAYPYDDRPSVEMLIAYNRSHQRGLLTSEKSAVCRKMPYAAVGCGSIFADILLGRLWRMADVKATQILAAYIVFMVKECVAGCGKLTQISAIHGSTIVSRESGATLVAAEKPISHMCWEEINELEKKFRTNWARHEQTTLWNLIAQEVREEKPAEQKG